MKQVQKFLKNIVYTENLSFPTNISYDEIKDRLEPAKEKLNVHLKANGITAHPMFFYFAQELIRNSYDHSRAKIIDTQIYAGPTGFVTAHFDGGSFYKDEETKRALESRQVIQSQHISTKSEGGSGMGLDFLVEEAQLIHVDTAKGILYAGIKAPHKVFEVEK